MPVVIVLYDKATGLCHWQLINRRTLVETSKGGWKVLVPEAQVLDARAVEPLRQAAEGDPYELRLRELRLARPWMQMLVSGTRLVVDFAEWINKSSGRGSIEIGIDHEDGTEPQKLVAWHLTVGPSSYAETVPKLFAWADAEVHPETYDEAEYDQYQAECTIWDEGEVFSTQSFAEWKAGSVPPGIHPYTHAAGEVDYYRIELTLNDLGKAFLVVDEFATTGERQFTEL